VTGGRRPAPHHVWPQAPPAPTPKLSAQLTTKLMPRACCGVKRAMSVFSSGCVLKRTKLNAARIATSLQSCNTNAAATQAGLRPMISVSASTQIQLRNQVMCAK